MSAFDSILQSIPADRRDHRARPGQTLYVYRPAKQRVTLYKPTFLGAWRESEQDKYYLVNPKLRVSCPIVKVEISQSAGAAHVILVHVIVEGIKEDRVEDLIKGLVLPGKQPYAVLSEQIGNWLSEFMLQQRPADADPLAHFSPALREECAAFISDQALSWYGLRIAITLRLPEEDLELPPFVIDLTEVLVNDDEEPLRSKLELKLRAPEKPEDKEYASQHLPPLEKLKTEIATKAMEWFRTDCSLEEFCYDVPSLRPKLEAHLKTYIEGKLRMRLFYFRLTCTVPFEKEWQVPETYEVACTLHPGEIKVQVQHNLLLERLNIATFRKANIADLGAWIKNTLESKTRVAFFEKKYVDVVIDFETLSDKIKSDVKKSLNHIGFDAQQHITVPGDGQMREWIDKTLSFDTGPVSFRTRDAKVEYRLSTQARVTFIDFERVKNYLQPGDYLRNEFKRIATEAAAEKLRTLTPEDLYLHFTDDLAGMDGTNATVPPASENKKEERSLETEVKNQITEVLFQKFNARTDNITLTAEPSELTNLYSAIRPARNHSLVITIEARGHMGESLEYAIDYRIVSIAAWDKFQELCTNTRGADEAAKAKEIMEAIDQMLRNPAASKLQQL
ncbi:MAG TPA: hypothetical protein VGO11_06340, partial [Chthoniobacteraceae bacterium]|nr:hypothetical protein [Chthoniobacteraceae bacterium]